MNKTDKNFSLDLWSLYQCRIETDNRQVKEIKVYEILVKCSNMFTFSPGCCESVD